jgi:hypothetical protein
MNMTHYMELLAVNQPWNLIIFMAIPVVLAETLAITELYLLFTRKFYGGVYYLNRFSGVAVGVYFIGIIIYLLMNAVIPITQAEEWRTFIDVVAVGAYLIAGLPLIWIALQEFGLVNRSLDQMAKLKIHAICVALFLVFGHIAMIAGMTDPSIFGYQGTGDHSMHEKHNTSKSPNQSGDQHMHQMHQMHDHHASQASATDQRMAVDFPPPMKEHILANMRDHLLAISEIQAAIGRGDYNQAADIAEIRMGQTALKSHGAYENSKFMPKGMQEIGTQMHRSASRFAIEIQNASATGDTRLALTALSKTTQACVACHAVYRLQ